MRSNHRFWNFRLCLLADEFDRRRDLFKEELLHYGEYLEQCFEEEEARLASNRARKEKRVRFKSHVEGF